MNVVFGVDRNFLYPALLSAYSVVKNASRPVDVTIFGQDFTAQDIAAVDQLNRAVDNGTVRYREFQSETLGRFSEFKTKYPKITLLPLFLPEFFSGRCLFIDADTLVLGDVCELQELDMNGHGIGACVDMGLVTLGEGRFLRPSLQSVLRPGHEHQKSVTRVLRSIRLGFLPGENYFNAGILLMDCEAIRNSPAGKELGDFDKLIPHIHDLPEQDRMNQIFAGQWLRLPQQWNTRPQIWYDAHSPKFRHTSAEFRNQLKQASQNPKMWHYIGGKKPWRAKPASQILLRRAFRDYQEYLARFEGETGLTFSV
ncbi:glycosyltransferase family 8 protein [Ruegeria arenilitoris]|uniref:glycosyltransferase family 8 protein n=1 Tax=Ruegeria arenilitoris TaxID=1173585 RepID=UPI00147F2688|nr:glycosyltransferase family 8 protein [Ruegeria arenilitoris]